MASREAQRQGARNPPLSGRVAHARSNPSWSDPTHLATRADPCYQGSMQPAHAAWLILGALLAGCVGGYPRPVGGYSPVYGDQYDRGYYGDRYWYSDRYNQGREARELAEDQARARRQLRRDQEERRDNLLDKQAERREVGE